VEAFGWTCQAMHSIIIIGDALGKVH